MGTIIKFPEVDNAPEQDLYNALEEVIGKFAGQMSVAAAVGVIEMVKTDVMNQAKK
jgi:hypothetical protein